MSILPFDYNVWSINKDSLQCIFMDQAVTSLIQHVDLDGAVRLIGYVRHLNKTRILEWDTNGEDTGIPRVKEYKLRMKWKDK